MRLQHVLAYPTAYHWLRQVMTLGMPFDTWLGKYGLNDPEQRVADLGCGPADILRFLRRGRGPGYYVGIDVDERNLQAARKRADRKGVVAEFHRMDLHLLPTDAAVRDSLRRVLTAQEITVVLLLGVVHHIDDDAVRSTLELIHSVRSVQTLWTTDVVYLPGARINNYFCSLDRGKFVRDMSGYAALAAASPWTNFETSWSSPGLSYIRYLHYRYTK